MEKVTVARAPGSRFGRYRLIRLLGAGGFGEVYVAVDTEKDRHVALKLIAEPYSADPDFRERLYREAGTAGRLHDPHVVPIHTFGEIDGQLYIDMRLIEGVDLATRLHTDGALDPARAVWIVSQVASALDAAHAAGIVHRDVKPANILLADDDFACLVDFGVAGAAGSARLTGTGVTIGTLAYMAPERFGLGDADGRADVYALACVLYECLTGDVPYPAGTDLPSLMGSHLHAPIPRPTLHRAGLASGFDDVIARGMAKDPDRRYASAGELARAAAAALGTPVVAETERADAAAWVPTMHAAAPTVVPAQAPEPKPSRKAPKVGIPAAVVVLVAAVGVGVYVSKGDDAASRNTTRPVGSAETTTAQPDPRQSVIPASGFDGSAGLAVDASGAVYSTDSNGATLLMVAPGSTAPTSVSLQTGEKPEHLRVDHVMADVGGTVWALWSDMGDMYLVNVTKGTLSVMLPDLSTRVSYYTPYLYAFAIDPAGTLYVSDTPTGVVALSAGSGAWQPVPFGPVGRVEGLAVDGQGNVYAADVLNNKVLKLPAGTTMPTVLPFKGVDRPSKIAVDAAGNVYVTESVGERVLRMTPDGVQSELPITGLDQAGAIAAAPDGSVYVLNGYASGASVVKLAAK